MISLHIIVYLLFNYVSVTVFIFLFAWVKYSVLSLNILVPCFNYLNFPITVSVYILLIRTHTSFKHNFAFVYGFIKYMSAFST